MEIIEKRDSNINMCRHCYKNKSEFKGLWATFFEEVDIEGIARLSIFDHLSVNKYWLITQPYCVDDETGEIYRETAIFLIDLPFERPSSIISCLGVTLNGLIGKTSQVLH